MTIHGRLRLQAISLGEANAFVVEHHRHHVPPQGHKFSIACNDGEKIVGVAIIGRPISRHEDTGETLELTRLCVDGTRNAASFLLGASRKATFALGYKRLITYTLPEEGGVSLVAAGYRCLGEAGGGSWDRAKTGGRIRIDKHPTQEKIKWESTLPSRSI